MKSKGIFRSAVVAVIPGNVFTLNEHALNMATAEVISTNQNSLSKRRLSILSSQTVVAERFLRTSRDRNGQQYTTGTGLQEGEPIVSLSNDTKKKQVYYQYMKAWYEIMVFVKKKRTRDGNWTNDVTSPLTLRSFQELWRQQCKAVRVMKPDSDCCDKCTQISELLWVGIDDGTRTILASLLEDDKSEAAEKFKVFTELHREARKKHLTENLHCVLDSAEKAHLPNLLRQPVKRHFITGTSVWRF